MTGIKFLGTGSALPEMTVTNEMLEKTVDTSDEWIRTRTGISSRRISGGETNLSLALAASRGALESAGVLPGEVGAVICATITPDFLTPSLACLLQRELGLRENVMAFDINAACSGFMYALKIAHSLLESCKKVLLVGSELLSRVTDFTDRGTCVLFGDGAGAAVVAAEEGSPFYFDCGAEGNSEALYVPCANRAENPFAKTPPARPPFLHMDGREVFRFAVEKTSASILRVLEKAGVRADEPEAYVLHQANERIIRAVAKAVGAPFERFFLNIFRRGNTSAASIPLALDEMNAEGRLARGDRLVLAGFGGGLTYGSLYTVW